MKKIITFLLVFYNCMAQVPSGDLLVKLYNGTTATMNAISTPLTGSLFFNEDTKSVYIYKSSGWQNILSSPTGIVLEALNNITITGNGASATPYVISTQKPTLTQSNGTYTFDNQYDATTSFYIKDKYILDDKTTDISFAYSLRKLKSSHLGPLVRLRRNSDNQERDFYSSSTSETVNIAAINSWRGTANVFVTVWYDQSGLGRNAIQPINNFQPAFFPDATRPYIQGDGVNDFLEVQALLKEITYSGKDASIFTVISPSTGGTDQYTFGVITGGNNGTNRWIGGINFQTRVIFDPGVYSASNTREYTNSAFAGIFGQYSFIRNDNNNLLRQNTNQKASGTFNGECTHNVYFHLFSANGSTLYSTAKMTEFIMYKDNVNNLIYVPIENNQISYWNL